MGSEINPRGSGRKICSRPHTFFYCAPPFWQTEGYGVAFPFEEYEQMAATMRTRAGKIMVSINDHPDIRRVFEGFEMEKASLNYTVGKSGRDAARGELIVYSWDRAAAPAGLFQRQCGKVSPSQGATLREQRPCWTRRKIE